MRSIGSLLGAALTLAASAAALSACSAILGLQDRTLVEEDASGTPGHDASMGSDAAPLSDAGTGPGQDATTGGDAMTGGDAATRPDSGGRDTGTDAPIVSTCPQASCTMATALNHPFAMTSDANRVYWTEYGTTTPSADGKVRSCPLGGCPDAGPMDYATGQSNPTGIAVDTQNVYWSTSGGIFYCPVAGCPGGPQLLAQAAAPFGIAVAAGSIYWVEQGDVNTNATVHRMRGPGQTNETLYDGGTNVLFSPQECVVDTQSVYIIDYYADVYRMAINGGEPAVLANGTNSGGWGIQIDSNAVYYTQINEIHRAAKNATDGGPIIYGKALDPNGIFLDSTAGFLYWSDWGSGNANDGTVGKVPTDGGPAVVLSVSQVTPEAVTVSGPYVYWMSNGTLDTTNPATNSALPNSGALYRAAK